MKPIKKDHWICAKCGQDEVVLEGKIPKIMEVSVLSHKYLFCPDCVYEIEPWKQHVNEDDLSGPKRKPKEVVEPFDMVKHYEGKMEHLNEKTNELVTVPR